MMKLKLSKTSENEYDTNMTVSEVHAKEMYEQLREHFENVNKEQQ